MADWTLWDVTRGVSKVRFLLNQIFLFRLWIFRPPHPFIFACIDLLIFVSLSGFVLSQLSLANEAPSDLVYQGRIMKPDNSPLEAASVAFDVSVFSQDGICLLYEEIHTVNMTNSGGSFALPLGSGVPVGPAYSLKEVFSNTGSFTGGGSCPYAPLTGHSRLLRVTFDEGSGPVALQDQTINSVPYALYASKLEGKGKSDFLQINTTTSALSQANANSLFQNATYTELMALAGGTSTVFAKSADLPVSGGVLNLSGAGQGVRVLDVPAGGDYAVNKNYSDGKIGGKAIDAANFAGLANGESVKWDTSANSGLGGWVRYSPPSTSGTSGKIAKFTSSSAVGDSVLTEASGKIGFNASTPSYDLSFGGESARSLGVERHSTADTAGNSLTLKAGGATSGATNKNGGNLILSSGIATGTGSSDIVFQPVAAGGTGVANRNPAENMRLNAFGLSGGGANAVGAGGSLAWGGGATASGLNTVAFGDNASAVSNWSAAIGWQASADNQHGIAIGGASYAGGYRSLALGYEADVTGGNSVAISAGVPAGAAPTVSGAESIGIFMGDQSGADVTASNVMAILGGNVGIGTTSPSSKLDVNGAQTFREMASASAPTPAATKTFLYADSTSHTLKFSVNGGAYKDVLPASALVRVCEIVIGDPGSASSVLVDDNDSPANCSNLTGSTMTVLSVECYSNAGSPTVNPILNGGSSTSILSSPLTCGTGSFAAGTLNGTPTQADNQSIDGNIDIAGGTAKYIVIRIKRTL
ncbi:MAG: hypothetical protein IPJ71_01545 [Bdellovibrionales bacterium]|nr:hypothetical protein [Bdellovibrionales bacterium]